MATNLDHLIAWTSPNLCVHPIPSYPIPFHRGWRGISCTLLPYRMPTHLSDLDQNVESLGGNNHVLSLLSRYMYLSTTDAGGCRLGDRRSAFCRGGFSRLGLAPWPSGLPAACPKKGSARVIFDNNMPLPFLSLHLYFRALGLVFQWNEIEISENKPKLHFLTGTGQRR